MPMSVSVVWSGRNSFIFVNLCKNSKQINVNFCRMQDSECYEWECVYDFPHTGQLDFVVQLHSKGIQKMFG